MPRTTPGVSGRCQLYTSLRRRTVDSHRALLCAALLLVSPCLAAAERLPVRIYTTADGLAHNTVYRILRDSQGFLWLCTVEGLSRFDGYAFRTFGSDYGLPAGAVNDLLETADGDFWVATDDGLVHLDGWKRSSSMSVRRTEAGEVSNGLPTIIPPGPEVRNRGITRLHQARDGTIWVGTRSGLFRLTYGENAASLQAVDIGLGDGFPEQRIISDLIEDRQGTLWIGTPVGLYRRRTDGRTVHYTEREGLPGHYISDLLEDRQGAVWVATREAGLFRLHTDASRTVIVNLSVTHADGLPDDWVPQLFQSSNGRFWAATARGLAELVFTDGSSRPTVRGYTAQQGLVDDYLGAIGEDLAGNLWLGSSLSGALKLIPDGFVTYSAREGIESVNAVFDDNAGQLCFRALVLADGGAQPGPAREQRAIDRYGCFDGTRFQWFSPSGLRLWGWVREGITLRTRNGEWWLGSEEGVLRYPPTDRFADLAKTGPLHVYRTEDGLPAVQIYRLFEDSRGDVWISSISSPTRGLSRFDRRTGRLFDLGKSPGLPSPVNDLVRSIAEDLSGNVWLAFNSGLARYASGVVSFFGAGEGLPTGAILDMHVDRSGRLWLASERAGLILVERPSESRPTFVRYTTANGLSSNSLAAIVEDRDGYLYVGGGNGLDRVDPTTGRVRHFTQADGLSPGVLKAAFSDRHGVLWFGMSNGLARLDPTPEKRTPAPPILISNLRVAGISYRVSPFGDRQIAIAELPPDDHQLEIEFVGLGFGPGEVLRYQYKLDGRTEWSPLSSRRAVTYASLSPGRYTFSVRAVNADGTASPLPATVAFAVRAPFWQRAWFIALVALTLASSGALAYRYRVARLLEVANMRTHIATDLHDDIGANLTRIALLSEVAQRTTDGAPFVSIATVARESIAAMSDIVWAIDPRRESLLDLTRRMRQHASELFTLRGIRLRFDAPAGDETQRLGIDIRRDLLLIFKEAINNAARHSGCTAVDIAVRLERGRLVLSVIDNGVGFDPSSSFDGQGLTSMRRRSTRIGAALRIEPAPSGTAVIVTLPIRS
jgi:ligand-binding sensor domain-containing protein/signal transduction histidine kinase